MNNLLVSVIIPTYERVDLTLSAVESALSQDYPEIEIIVVDDGSSKAVIEKLKMDLPINVKLVTLTHTGLPAIARNEGVELAKGDWIAFLDSDDLWFPNKISTQIQAAINGKYACVSAEFDRSDKKPLKKSNGCMELYLNDFLQANQVVNSSVVVRKDALASVGGIVSSFNVRGVEDYATWLRLVSQYRWLHLENSFGIYNLENSEYGRISTSGNSYNHYFAIIDFFSWTRNKGKKLILTRIFLRVMKLSLFAVRRK